MTRVFNLAAMVVNRPPIADVKETVGAPVVARPRSPATGINAQPESQPHSEGAYVYRDQLIPTAGKLLLTHALHFLFVPSFL